MLALLVTSGRASAAPAAGPAAGGEGAVLMKGAPCSMDALVHPDLHVAPCHPRHFGACSALACATCSRRARSAAVVRGPVDRAQPTASLHAWHAQHGAHALLAVSMPCLWRARPPCGAHAFPGARVPSNSHGASQRDASAHRRHPHTCHTLSGAARLECAFPHAGARR